MTIALIAALIAGNWSDASLSEKNVKAIMIARIATTYV
jgi:hypothetical protein